MTKENYKNLYDSLMIHRKSCPIVDLSQRDYEVHHIVPKSIGGSNQTENLVRLYMYEHFLAHKMLMHIYYGTEHEAKMKDAFWMMCYCGKDKKYNINKTSKQFQQDRILALQIDKHKLTGRKRINKDGKMKLVKLADLQRYLDDGWHMGGLPLTKEHRKNLSISGKGKKHKYTVTEKVKKHHQQLSKLYKGKILRKNKNTITITDGLHEKCVSLDFVIPKGWRRGRVNSVSKKLTGIKRIFSEEHRRNISIQRKGRRPKNVGMIGITNGIENKFIKYGDFIPEGWHLGFKKRGKYKISNKCNKNNRNEDTEKK